MAVAAKHLARQPVLNRRSTKLTSDTPQVCKEIAKKRSVDCGLRMHWKTKNQQLQGVATGVLSVELRQQGHEVDMQLDSGYFSEMPSYEQGTLQEMYESPELFNEGLLSFRYPIYHATDEELDYFLGGMIRSASRAVGGVTRTIARSPIGRAVGGAATTIGKAVSAVDKVVPVSMLTSAVTRTPLGMAFRAGLGAAQAAAEGRNVFQGAVRSLAPDVGTRFFVDTAIAAARGQNVLDAAKKAAQAGIGDVRKSLQLAAMVAPFVPGIGSGVAAAIGAANALAAGQPITDALIAAARNAVPGGAIAQFAFDTAMNLTKGKNIGDALLESARARLPGGPAAQAAFDAALTLAKGRNIQDALFAAAGRVMPKSPYASDVLSFVKKVAAGQNIQRAALSTAGNFILDKIERRTGPIASRVQATIPRAPIASLPRPGIPPWRRELPEISVEYTRPAWL